MRPNHMASLAVPLAISSSSFISCFVSSSSLHPEQEVVPTLSVWQCCILQARHENYARLAATSIQIHLSPSPDLRCQPACDRAAFHPLHWVIKGFSTDASRGLRVARSEIRCSCVRDFDQPFLEREISEAVSDWDDEMELR